MGVALIPFQIMISNKISRLLTTLNIKTIHIPDKIHVLKHIRDRLGMKVIVVSPANAAESVLDGLAAP
jgi:hypothetical protein